MPRGDRTGPAGMGAKTGHAAGLCTGSGMPGYANPAPGRGLGLGFGRGRGPWSRGFGGGGRGWRNTFHATGHPGWMRFGGYGYPTGYEPDAETEEQALKDRAEVLQSALDIIEKRLGKIETKTTGG